MRDHDIKANAVIGTRQGEQRDGRTLLAAGGIFGLLGVVGLEIFGFSRALPMLAALLVAAGFAIAAIAWVSGAKRHETQVSSWDLAGLLAFLGFASAMIAN
jgi:hypothetical protein